MRFYTASFIKNCSPPIVLILGGKKTDFEAAHRKQKPWVVLRVGADKGILPLDGINIVRDERHAIIPRLTMFIATR